MIGDSLAGEANNPEKQESLEVNSPEVSVSESDDSKAPETITSEATLNSLVSEEIQDKGESGSPEILLTQSEAIAIQDAPDLTVAETSETREIQATGESSSPDIPLAQTETIVIQDAPDLSYSESSETQESSSAEIPVAETEAIVIQDAPDLSYSENAELSEIQETEESSSVGEAEAVVIQETPDLSDSESSEIQEIQEKPELKVSQPATVSEPIKTSVESPLPIASETALNPNKDCLRILLTGASGCIGHYIAETLINETEHELFLLVRDPRKLRIDCNSRPGINVVQGDMKYISRLAKMLKTIDCAILTAAAWGGQQEALDVNVFKTMQLLNYLDPKVCQQVIYFSTASILDRHNHLLKEARELGTEYIRSKYEGLSRISKLPIADRLTTLFPTLVLGGDEKHPYSHISSGLPGLKKWINYIRFFKTEGSFHFIHAKDIAQVVYYLLKNPPSRDQKNWLVLGNQPTTVNQAVEEACEYLQKPIIFRVNLSPWLADILIWLFRIQMAAWDRFCLEYRHFTYTNPINPATFGLPVYCPTIKDLLKTSGISEPPQITLNSANYNSSKAVENRIKDYKQAFDDREK
ncbi:NAD-dependent epimerase/dehydratase family protein [Floridanema evergladense]|uniref:NAD-dependent epimerase/dehydratase family protein n=1 Tax=Floridaenema evergladense BLCC-F167 TaxID=3153639 RepID=A0ABV4WN73_9CYAN